MKHHASVSGGLDRRRRDVDSTVENWVDGDVGRLASMKSRLGARNITFNRFDHEPESVVLSEHE